MGESCCDVMKTDDCTGSTSFEVKVPEGDDCVEYTVEMGDFYGDGWQGGTVFFDGIEVGWTGSYDFQTLETVCLPDGVYEPYASCDEYPGEVYWNVVGTGVCGGAKFGDCAPTPPPTPSPDPTAAPSSAPSRQDWQFGPGGSFSYSSSYAVDCSTDCPPEFFATVANGEAAFCDEVAATGNGIFSCLSDCLDNVEGYVAMHCACGAK